MPIGTLDRQEGSHPEVKLQDYHLITFRVRSPLRDLSLPFGSMSRGHGQFRVDKARDALARSALSSAHDLHALQ